MATALSGSTISGTAGAQLAESYEVVRLVDTIVNNTDPGLNASDTFRDSENSLGVNPSNPDELVVLGFAESWSGTGTGPLFHSLDGGRSWTKRFTIPAPPGLSYTLPGDQTLDWGRNDELSFTFLAAGAGFTFDIVSSVTTDPADTNAFNFFAPGGVTQLTNGGNIGSLGNADQPWLITNRDPSVAAQDNVYVGYDDFNNSDGVDGPDMRVAVSYGSNPLDFTVDTQVGNSTNFINPGLRLTKNSASGEVYALWGRCVDNCGTDIKTIDYMLNRSADGGVNWSLDGDPLGIPVATALSTQPRPKFGTVNALLGGAHHAAVDPASGAVYYVYGNQDAAGNDRMAIRRLTVDAAGNATIGVQNFVTLLDAALPQVAVDDVGTVAVFYYSFDGFGPAPGSLPIFTAHVALSDDQGASFVDRTLLTFASPVADDGDPRQRILGDYQQMKAVGSCFYGAFTANGAPLGRPFDNTDGVFFKVCRPVQACVLASERLDIRDRTMLTAAVGAGDSMELGADASITGGAGVDGDVLLRSNSDIFGDLVLSGALEQQAGSDVAGSITETADVLLPSLVTKSFSAGTGNETIANGTVAVLNPGVRGNMTFGANSNVTLNPGVYTFASLVIEPDAQVTALGNVEIDVQGQLTIGDRADVIGSASQNLLLYSNGTAVSVGTDANVTGVLVAPSASVNVASRTNVSGCVGGRNVTIDTDSIVNGTNASLPISAPAAATCDDGKVNGAETDVDCGGPVCAPCSSGGHCASANDCVSGVCTDGTCDGGSFSASASVIADWGGGYCVKIVATNGSTVATTDWDVMLDTGASTIYTSWNGTFSSSSGVIAAEPAFSWNRVIGPGASNDSVGFCANRAVPGSGVLPNIVSASATF